MSACVEQACLTNEARGSAARDGSDRRLAIFADDYNCRRYHESGPYLPAGSGEIVDARGLLVVPGLIAMGQMLPLCLP